MGALSRGSYLSSAGLLLLLCGSALCKGKSWDIEHPRGCALVVFFASINCNLASVSVPFAHAFIRKGSGDTSSNSASSWIRTTCSWCCFSHQFLFLISICVSDKQRKDSPWLLPDSQIHTAEWRNGDIVVQQFKRRNTSHRLDTLFRLMSDGHYTCL